MRALIVLTVGLAFGWVLYGLPPWKAAVTFAVAIAVYLLGLTAAAA